MLYLIRQPSSSTSHVEHSRRTLAFCSLFSKNPGYDTSECRDFINDLKMLSKEPMVRPILKSQNHSFSFLMLLEWHMVESSRLVFFLVNNVKYYEYLQSLSKLESPPGLWMLLQKLSRARSTDQQPIQKKFWNRS